MLSSIQPLSPLILDGVPQPVWLVDARGNILYFNRAGLDALGYDDPSELVGRSSHATVHHSHEDGTPFPEAECRMLLPSRTGLPEHGDEYWFARRDGSLFPISWWSSPIQLPDGMGIITSFTDLTERRRIERAAREAAAAEVRAMESRAAQRRVMDATAEIRRRTARDLHDGAQQRLVSLAILLGLAREEVAPLAPGALDLLERARREAQSAIDELRELASGVYPSVLSRQGLVAAVESLAVGCAIPLHVEGRLHLRLPEAVAAHAYFVVAEAVTNAAKHAAPSRIRVRIASEEGLLVQIVDDGRGAPPHISPGSGIVGMRDRVTALGGSLDIVSTPGEGTTVSMWVPGPFPS